MIARNPKILEVSNILFEEPAKAEYGEITRAHTLTLEKDIQENPQYWLWSHKRWKHKRPDSLK